MEIAFKFEIGQFVYIRQELRAWHQLSGVINRGEGRAFLTMGELAAEERKPRGCRVIERLSLECYGGLQLNYRLRAGAALFEMTEPELTSDFNDLT